MDQSLREIADFAHWWLANDEGPNDSLWILTDPNDPANPGMDIAYRMAKLYLGAEQRPEIPYDSLPVCPGFNAETGNCVFVLSQPNHVPSVQVSMQGAIGRLRRYSPDVAAENTMKILAGKKDLDEVAGADDLEVDGIYSDKEAPKQPEVPSKVLVHQREPMWSEIKQFIVPSTDVLMSDLVEVGPAIADDSTASELDPNRYSPDAD